ncbi:cytochrome P450 [Mycobacterium sp. PSTR-4-N]|uniref:cytochrome P450 n=1 Tax=Mycobacterium sp. PSTR-4-N TaxID=2917745 RepID=UPI001F1515CC|nr:cytochrome P450 [Mycobacterium sp. PSTR-4-N]MCG7597830.1 cytochrome P450 [Mycobacterium sp. PSTR-4-N]
MRVVTVASAGGDAVVTVLPPLPATCIADRERYWVSLAALGPVLLVRDDDVFGMGYPAGDSYYLTQRTDILAALKNAGALTRRDGAYVTMPAPLRKITGNAMSPGVVKALQPELRRRAALLIGAARRTAWTSQAFIDLTDTFACEVFLALIGIPLGGAPVELEHVISERRTAFSAALLDVVTVTEAVAVYVGLLSDGRPIHSIAASLRNALIELDRNPRRAADLEQFADDVFRHHTPLPVMVRHTTQPLAVAGLVIPPDSRVVLCIEGASAGRTEAHGHLAFGTAAGGCVGHHLSKLALVEFVRAWLVQG